MEKKYNWNGVWTIKHIRKGEVIWEDTGNNSLVQQGEVAMLESFFKNTVDSAPTEFYVRLCNSTPSITSTLPSIIGEASGFGYAAQLLPRSSVGWIESDYTGAGNYRLKSKVVTFTASGGSIGPVTNAYLATVDGVDIPDISPIAKLIAFRALSMTRTILDGDSMTIQIRIDLG